MFTYHEVPQFPTHEGGLYTLQAGNDQPCPACMEPRVRDSVHVWCFGCGLRIHRYCAEYVPEHDFYECVVCLREWD